MKQVSNQSGSFRDPSGFLFYEDGVLLRQVNKVYQEDYEFMMNSGLYDALCTEKLLVPHIESTEHPGLNELSYKVIQPELIPFISYPYEWSYNQLKDAALLTLRVQEIALQHQMTLKDGSAYNVQFLHGKPVFIDTLSFERYQESKPWGAYKQFCQHFLAPLTLMAYTDIRLNQMMKLFIDGIPLDIASKILPWKTRLKFATLMHIHLHAKTQRKYANEGTAARKVKISKANQIALIQNLRSAIRNGPVPSQKTEWGDYYSFTNYTDASFLAKEEIITGWIQEIKPGSVWDLGANTGEFSRIPARNGIPCVSFDIDPVAVDKHYQFIRQQDITNILPLVLDLTNPSPSIGWQNEEREGFMQRPHPDVLFALALIHHLAISNNLPFSKIGRFFSDLSDNLIIEFVPKEDSQVRKLLESRKDVFPDYDEGEFENQFGIYFDILDKKRIAQSHRTLYRMRKR